MSIVPGTNDAPGLFSTTNATPICAESCCVRIRISTSTEPPGADGTTKWIGFSGYAARAASPKMSSGTATREERPATATRPGGARTPRPRRSCGGPRFDDGLQRKDRSAPDHAQLRLAADAVGGEVRGDPAQAARRRAVDRQDDVARDNARLGRRPAVDDGHHHHAARLARLAVQR